MADGQGGSDPEPDPFADVWGWWRADDFSGTTPNVILNDKSGNGRTMTQAAGTLTAGTAANGQARFTGNSTARLTSTATIEAWPITMITVARRTADAACGFFGHTGASPFNTLWYGYETVNRFAIYNNSSNLNTTAETGADGCYLVRIGHGSRVSHLNGVILPIMNRSTMIGPGTATTVSLGTEYRGLNCHWQETLIWNRPLSVEELDLVYTYINERYSMSVPLWSSLTEVDTIVNEGQSNMAGRGDRGASDANIPAEYDGALTNVNIWHGTTTANIGSAFETLNINNNNHMLGDDAQAATYIGPDVTLGKEYEDRTGRPLYIIKYATGGTNLAYSATLGYWHPTAYITRAHNSQSRLYGQLGQNFWAAMRVMQAAGIKPNIKALIKFQGEQDATTQADAEAWSANCQLFYQHLEEELGFGISKKKLICRIHINGSETFETTLRAQQALAVSALTNATLIDTDSLATRVGDGVHIGVQGQLDLGNILQNLL